MVCWIGKCFLKMANKTKPNFGAVMVYKVKFNFGLSVG